MVRRLLAAASLVALAGCLKPYVSSTRDDAATLTLVSEARAAYVAVMGWRSDRCDLGIARAEGARLVPEPTARRRISLVAGSADGFQNPCSDPAPIPVDQAAHGKEGGNSQKEE